MIPNITGEYLGTKSSMALGYEAGFLYGIAVVLAIYDRRQAFPTESTEQTAEVIGCSPETVGRFSRRQPRVWTESGEDFTWLDDMVKIDRPFATEEYYDVLHRAIKHRRKRHPEESTMATALAVGCRESDVENWMRVFPVRSKTDFRDLHGRPIDSHGNPLQDAVPTGIQED